MDYRGLTLDPFQEQAITWLRDGRSVLVCAPTGTGKTLVADAVVDLALEEGRQVIYTAPVKALSNQKFRDYCRLHGEQNVGLVTGDLVIRRDAPCLVMTTEILRNMLLVHEDLSDLKAVVLDEIHFLDDRERGTVWEEVLIYLSPDVQVVGLSATLSNVEEFAEWLSTVRGKRVEVVEEHTRAVPLSIKLANWDCGVVDPDQFPAWHKRWKKKEQGNRPARGQKRQRSRGRAPVRQRHRYTSHVELYRMLREQHMPYLYFVPSRKLAELAARRLGENVRGSLVPQADQERLDKHLSDAFDRLGYAVLDPDLVSLYRRGIGFHHAGLHVQLKALVEDLYERKLLQVLYTTTTFALGINMPARTVVMDGLVEFNGHSMMPLSIRQFMQKAGRAGRRGMDDHGTVIVRMDYPDWPKLEAEMRRYLHGQSEPVRSTFNLSLNSVVNLLQQRGRDHCRAIVEKSFLAFRQGKDTRHLVQQSQGLQGQLSSMGVEPGAWPKSPKLQRKVKDLKKLKKRIKLGGVKVWRDFERRRQFLVDLGYLGEDDSLKAGGKVLQHIQIQEVFTTEIVLAGVLEGQPPATLFGLLCAMTGRLPKGVHLYTHRLPPRLRGLAVACDEIRQSEPVGKSEALLGLEVNWCPPLMAFGEAWYNGDTLEQIYELYSSETDISGGLISGFRRAKDLAGQLREAHGEHEQMATMFRKMVKTVSRDEVEVVA
ncbi:MAG: DEAD/DEAH box helicase [Proteobacteria bacterium]|nr:DEAD/DEAH box helicase [Pseudomonadota bacterium]MCP4920421.1 DEAD/DEAH box helicase [Pseudomonadota bacterium]